MARPLQASSRLCPGQWSEGRGAGPSPLRGSSSLHPISRASRESGEDEYRRNRNSILSWGLWGLTRAQAQGRAEVLTAQDQRGRQRWLSQEGLSSPDTCPPRSPRGWKPRCAMLLSWLCCESNCGDAGQRPPSPPELPHSWSASSRWRVNCGPQKQCASRSHAGRGPSAAAPHSLRPAGGVGVASQ